MNLKKLININFWRFDHKHYKDLYDYDIRFNASFRNTEKLSKDVLRSYELKCLSLYRKAQVAQGTVWGKYYFHKLKKFGLCTGINLLAEHAYRQRTDYRSFRYHYLK